MYLFTVAADLGSCGSAKLVMRSPLVGLAWAIHGQAGWVLLATFFALDLWIVFGMVMMHLKGSW
jgi:hypothetical protein